MGFRHPQIQPESGLCHPRPPANLSHGACETLCLRAGLVHVSAPRSRHIRLPAHTDLTGAVRPGPGLRNATPRPNGQKRVHSLRPSLSRGDRNGQGAMPLEEAPRRQIRQKAVKFLQDFTKASLTPKVMTGGFGDTGSFLRPHCSAHLVSVYYRLLSGHVHFPKVRDLLQCPLIGNPRFILKDLKKKKTNFLQIPTHVQKVAHLQMQTSTSKTGTQTCRSKPHSKTPYLSSWPANKAGPLGQGTLTLKDAVSSQ